MITDLYTLLSALVQDDDRLSEEDAQAAQNVIAAAQTAQILGIPA